MYIQACMRTHINVHIKTHVHAPKFSYSHACMQTHADTSKHLYIYILTCKSKLALLMI